jgi:hypothetical protein
MQARARTSPLPHVMSQWKRATRSIAIAEANTTAKKKNPLDDLSS